MNIQLKPRLTVTEFLNWAIAQPSGRFELVDGEIIKTSPETLRHSHVKHRCATALEAAIGRAGLNCTVFGDGVTIEIDLNNSREPDAVVQCGAFDPDSLIADRPMLVVEVASPTSERRDYVDKLSDYKKIPSIIHYIIVQPVQRTVTLHSRTSAAEGFQASLHKSGTIDLSPPGFSVTVEDLLGPPMERP